MYSQTIVFTAVVFACLGLVVAQFGIGNVGFGGLGGIGGGLGGLGGGLGGIGGIGGLGGYGGLGAGLGANTAGSGWGAAAQPTQMLQPMQLAMPVQTSSGWGAQTQPQVQLQPVQLTMPIQNTAAIPTQPIAAAATQPIAAPVAATAPIQALAIPSQNAAGWGSVLGR
ncbi:elastin-like [Paramacrobiotus metropolitanus]|uniref:elastin-like n=1 Tax=Paramacrobiotus metropolitanus TaxID=2943436 RepID=UPI002445D272|nr:elastin-like [Paramacrobiotus metropolitanus]